jgi:hypothetical protein
MECPNSEPATYSTLFDHLCSISRVFEPGSLFHIKLDTVDDLLVQPRQLKLFTSEKLAIAVVPPQI